jgi:hypothetical protein
MNSTLRGDVLENSVQFSFRAEVDFKSTTFPPSDDADFRPEGETQPVFSRPGMYVL